MYVTGVHLMSEYLIGVYVTGVHRRVPHRHAY
jgi:hypothetical protein